MAEEYYEIVHIDQNELYERPNEKIRENILDLDKRVTLHFYLGLTSMNFPDIPKDTKIILGGKYGGYSGRVSGCVTERKKQYEKHGFTNVIIDDNITIYFS